MITKDNLAALLLHPNFGFTKRGNIYKKEYSQGASIEVNTDTQKITYSPVDSLFKEGEFPTKDKPANGFVIHRDTTLNFSANENFVCLVCTHLLLKKGYEPKHIVFEPAFKVGHVNKPSYGDILVFDKEYNPLVLIENKTFGTEFSKEWNLMQKDGGQLFSYLGPLVNVMGRCQNLVLFAADFDEKEVLLKNHIITLKDNEKRLKELDNAKSFADAQGKYYEVWDQTYGKSFETKGLFEDDIEAYSVGKLKYTINDLKGLSHAEIRPIYHEFATILRNHAITDFEHSFYILIDLFLCKITDELNNPDDLQFYYKGIARDTPKEYCNRLLKLYQQGKRQLFNVEVVNKDEEDIKQIFEDTGRSLVTNGLFAGIKELFEEMKFYNIKKFNFIDVENREEFEMNFQILIKIAALIQDINLSSSETNHFFGDLFEGLLSKNVHQTEGQFFTPLPIVNFIINSLPQFPNTDKVKVLDYACGAGHFLTEFVKHYPKAKIYGIEKSQTLSQVAKIATIINGCQDSRIIFKDSLSHINTMDVRYQGFEKESFDCIIANPPYSVKGFLNTMEQKDRDQFELAKTIEEKTFSTNRSIECFFVERAHYFLKKDGLMGIVLPSSLLSNENIYTKTREIIFANFNILAIAVMNSRTFGSTGTNTVILFAQKVKKNSEGLLHTFLDKKDYTQYTTSSAIDSYIKKQGYSKDEYFAFMQDNVLGDNLKETNVFKDYAANFKKSSISKSIQKEWFAKSSYYLEGLKESSKEYKKQFALFLSSDDYKQLEEAEYKRQFVAFAKDIECKKLNVYIQTENNIVAILQSPPEKVNNKSNKAEVVKFLGYDWSNRKGDEGIKYLTSKVQETATSDDEDDKDTEIVQAINSIKYIETPLYNPGDDNDVSKFSYALRKHITGSCNKFSFGTAKAIIEKPFVGENNALLQIARLTDLIDFGKTSFNLAIRTLVEQKEAVVQYRCPTKRLEQLLLPIDGSLTKISKEEILSEGEYPVITQEADNLISGYTNINEPITDLPLIVFGDHSCTFKYADFKFVRGADGTQLIKVNEEEILTKYLYHFLLTIKIENSEKYERHFKYLKNIQIPLPSITQQQKIETECQKIDDESHKAEERISELQENINVIVTDIKGKITKLGTIAQFKNGLNYKETPVGDTVSIVGVANFKDNKSPKWDEVKTITISDNVDDSYLLHKNDLVTVRSNGSRELVGRFMLIDKEPEERTTFSGFSIRVRIVSDEVDSEFLYYLLSSANIKQRLTTGSNGANIKSLNQDLLSNLEIPLPSLSEQKNVIDKIGAIESQIASLKAICDEAADRKKAVLHRELIEDDKQESTIETVEIDTEKDESKAIILPEYREGCIPLYTLRAACGYFEDEEVPEEEGWVDASNNGFTPDPKRHFVIHAKGNSMLPKIKDGDLCVFEWYRAGSRNGEIVLTQSSEFDSDYGGKYTIKKYHSEKVVTEEGWQHSKVELIPLNKDFDVIVLDEETEYRTIGILKCVL
ncbi:Type I restriction-modification system, DNA methylase subunit [Prevotella aff. ruminicola Tc2-24]|uniref:Type I restriction-modification system, DNA methylase subunit n=1 Tax=Prevotella aff. ruminicola Tc2-24 TaxID=81582 RepID=A0A1I0MNG9_9BACT|nr:N-6 DNA methylase [Prevotella aff. ruminicola Tc2-24]SEV89730.1 Type I restriction-modification system, DNA methylase subunit [Prevotella aff. ruminicola Tc2-24]